MTDQDFYSKAELQSESFHLPEWMSFSQRKRFNQWPRQFYYSNCDYSQGLNNPILDGIVYHDALEELIKLCQKYKCVNKRDLGDLLLARNSNYPLLINQVKEDIVSKYNDDQRFLRKKNKIIQRFDRSSEILQEKITERINELFKDENFIKNNRKARSEFTHKKESFNIGNYSEVWIKSDLIGDRGKVDLLKIKDEGVEIIDFKTGKPRDVDKDQLYFYQILWKDDKRNRDQKPALKLILEYPNDRKVIDPLTDEELKKLRMIYIEEERQIRSATSVHDFETVISDLCKNCFCRQLCADYWKKEKDTNLPESGYIDIEVEVKKDYESKKIVSFEKNKKKYEEVTLSFHELSDPLIGIMKNGSKNRILNAQVCKDDDNKIQIKVSRDSEVFNEGHYKNDI